MTNPCPYCRGPLRGRGLTGRPWPGRPEPAVYCCYGCLSLGEQRLQQYTSPTDPPARKLDWLGVRLGLAAVVAAQSMIFGLALNLHPDDVPPDVRAAVQGAMLAATLAVAGLLGGPLAVAAGRELRAGRVTVEALFVVTLVGALAASLQAHVTGRGAVYYEVVSILLVVYTVGKVVAARGRATALAATRAWADHLATCRLVPPGSDLSHPAPVHTVRPGDVVEVRPGETIPVDGVIRRGAGYVSEAAVSGEPFPVVRRPGDRVTAGAASHDATFRVEATAAGTDRQIDRLLGVIDAARDRPLSLQARADRLGAVFLPVVLLTAAGTFAYWAGFTAVGWEAALFRAMSVLLVACPCVIGLATPVVVWAVVGRLADRGLIARTGDAVERLADVDRVLFDKTGTLTDDAFAVVDIVTAADGPERERLLGLLAVVQSHSSHPIAKPFAALPRTFAPGDEPAVTDLRTIPGAGIEASVGRHRLRVGKPDWIAPPYRQEAAVLRKLSVELTTETGQRIAVELDGQPVAVAAVAERLRESTPEALAEFRRLGLVVEVLTGDAPGRSEALGLPPAVAGLLPADKHRRVVELVTAGHRPLMVGDGINDGSALAAAHVGVALASGTDLAVGAAGLTLYHGDLRALPWAVELSRDAVRIVRRNLRAAVAYNLAGMGLAAAGLLHPVAAALLMVASSLTLVFSSLRAGADPRHCDTAVTAGVGESPRTAVRGLWARSFLHGLALALQGPLLAALLGLPLPLAVALSLASAAAGLFLASEWHRRPALPHTLDMAFGMLTAGNLGMLLGWWADAGFAPLACAECCACHDLDPAKPWMWVGMLLFANAAMLWLGRRPMPGGSHAMAMFSGGNVGMLAGMGAGGWAAWLAAVASVPAAGLLHFAGMTAGMVAGMHLGTAAAELLLDALAGGRLVVSRPVLEERVAG